MSNLTKAELDLYYVKILIKQKFITVCEIPSQYLERQKIEIKIKFWIKKKNEFWISKNQSIFSYKLSARFFDIKKSIFGYKKMKFLIKKNLDFDIKTSIPFLDTFLYQKIFFF